MNVEALNNELAQWGTIEFLGQNNDISFIVVVTQWVGTENDFQVIAETYIRPNYPVAVNFTLIDGTIKAEYNI